MRPTRRDRDHAFARALQQSRDFGGGAPPLLTRMILTYHLNKDRIRPDGNGPEESLRIPLLNRGPVQVSILRPLGSSS